MWYKTKFYGEGNADKLTIDEEDILSISATEYSDEFDFIGKQLSSKVIYRIR